VEHPIAFGWLAGLSLVMMCNPTGSRRVPKAFGHSPNHAFLIKSLVVAAVLPLLAGCVEREVVYRDRPAYVPAPAPSVEVVADEPPMPPPQAEYITVSPGPGFIWMGGSWEWRGRWEWSGGRWGHPPHTGAVWGRGHWHNHGGSRVWVSAGWR
jgi:hypothetical protein